MTYASEVAADNPTIYLRLEEASGTAAADASGNGNHGTYVGQYTLGQASLVPSAPSDKSVMFSNPGGTPGKVSVPVVPLGMTWTIEMIVKPVSGNGVSGDQCLFIARSGSNLNNAIWIVYSTTNQRIQVFGSVPGGADCFTGVYANSIAPGSAYHVAAVLDGSAARLYINGAEAAIDNTLSGTIDITASATDGAFAFGAPFSGAYPSAYGGLLDELAVYSGSALSAARVAAHYAAYQQATLANATGVQAASAAGTVTTSGFTTGVDPIIALEADWLSDQALAAAQAGPTPEQVEAEFLACMQKVRSVATADSRGIYSTRYRPSVPCLEALAARIADHDPLYTVTIPGDPYVWGHGSIELSWRIDPP